MKYSSWRVLNHLVASIAVLLAATSSAPVWATPILTLAGTTAGFTLSQFADEFPTTGICCGPLGIAFPTSGGVMVSDYPGNVRVFATDAD